LAAATDVGTTARRLAAVRVRGEGVVAQAESAKQREAGQRRDRRQVWEKVVVQPQNLQAQKFLQASCRSDAIVAQIERP
jgi:hypothetical protein